MKIKYVVAPLSLISVLTLSACAGIGGKAATAAAVSQWLTHARVQAQALPVQARLGRSTATGASSPTGNLVAPATAGHSTTAAPVGALGAISAPAAPQNPAPSPGATPGSGLVWWEGQIVLQLPAPAKP